MQSSKLWDYEITDETGVSDTLTSEHIATPNSRKTANLSVEWNNQINDQIDSRSVNEIRETRSRSQGQKMKKMASGFQNPSVVSQNLRTCRKKDPDLRPIYRWVTAGNRPHGNDVTLESPEARHYLWDSLRLVE